jgi:ABC-2 type transport system permease protein
MKTQQNQSAANLFRRPGAILWLTIARRELRSLFLSPLAWSILAVVQFIAAWLFLSQLDIYLMLQPRLAGLENAPGVTDLLVAPVFGNIAVLLLLVTPMLTMRLLAGERANGTLTLLTSSPAGALDIVLGKYLGLLGFLLLMIGMLSLMPLSLQAGTNLDLGKMAAGLLGLVLLVAAFAAIGLFMSSIASQPTVAAVSTFGILLLLWVIDWAGQSGGDARPLLAYLSLLRHYESLLMGLFDSADLAYYLLLSATFLGLAVRRLDADRMGGAGLTP